MIVLALLLAGFVAAPPRPSSFQDEDPARMMGQALYERACARCHGADGRGDRPDIQLNAPMPNFARCAESAEETDAQWRRTIEKGGIVYGLSDEMPAYGDVLSRAQVDSLLAYLRDFCGNPRWARGELNFRRPLFTEKAYPENELVLGPRLERSPGAPASFTLAGTWERRLGPRTQMEVVVPLSSLAQGEPGRQPRRQLGVGDVELGVKQVVAASLPRRFILSTGLDVAFPTGRSSAGLGTGTYRFEPFVAAGKELAGWALQGQVSVEIPADRQKSERELQYSVVIGRPVYFIREVRDLFGALEVVVTRELARGEPNRIFLAPQLRLPIDRLGRWAFAAGPTIPLTQRSTNRAGFAAYLLWEYLGR
jgi:mono/diheme cytochrome c family protein